jgi:hypothetical protein
MENLETTLSPGTSPASRSEPEQPHYRLRPAAGFTFFEKSAFPPANGRLKNYSPAGNPRNRAAGFADKNLNGGVSPAGSGNRAGIRRQESAPQLIIQVLKESERRFV